VANGKRTASPQNGQWNWVGGANVRAKLVVPSTSDCSASPDIVNGITTDTASGLQSYPTGQTYTGTLSSTSNYTDGWLGFVTGEQPRTMQAQVAFAYLLSLRTGMRAGEVLQLGPKTVQGAVATVAHKMQYRTGKPRKVPLSKHAQRLLKGFAGFTVTSESLDALFRKARDSLLIEDLHFHDARAAALTRFSRKVDVLELARISGHKDLRQLLNTYYRASSEDIASRL
jgi:integrase